MACDHPLYVWGGVNSQEHRVPVPCGKCVPCKKRRVDSWVFRLMQEAKRHKYCHFVTLTYDTQFVPISPNGFMTLRRGHELVLRKKPSKDGSLYKQVTLCHFVNFMKRLRKLIPGATIKYYFAGEYGSKKHRPHYHAIIFGVAEPELYAKAWSLDGQQLGFVHVGEVTDDSVAYTMKYIDKSNFQKRHARDDREPEYSGMSKGLGLNFVTDAMREYYTADLERLYVTKRSGHRVAMPRYYRERLLTSVQRKMQHPIIKHNVEQQELKDRILFQYKFKHVPDFTYEEYKERQKLGKQTNFNKRLKTRDYE